MFQKILENNISLKNCLTLLCASLTLFLIYRELVTFAVTKPTISSKEEKELETRDLPEVVACLVPGFDDEVMQKYHYGDDHYYRGADNEHKFIGWNGGGEENKSSQMILDEILTFDNQLINKLVHKLLYIEEHVNQVPVKARSRMLSYPYGRCLSISAPSPKNSSYTRLNSLYLKLNGHLFSPKKVFPCF